MMYVRKCRRPSFSYSRFDQIIRDYARASYSPQQLLELQHNYVDALLDPRKTDDASGRMLREYILQHLDYHISSAITPGSLLAEDPRVRRWLLHPDDDFIPQIFRAIQAHVAVADIVTAFAKQADHGATLTLFYRLMSMAQGLTLEQKCGYCKRALSSLEAIEAPTPDQIINGMHCSKMCFSICFYV